MAKNDYTKMILAQIETFLVSSTEAMGMDHPTVLILQQTVQQLKDEALTVLPDGFKNDDEFEDFIHQQTDAFQGELSENEILTNVDDVVGIIQDANGNDVEIGDVVTSTERANQILAEMEEMDGVPLDASNIMRITYERQDGQELTTNHVDMILKHPASRSLSQLGKIDLLIIEDTDNSARKTAVFSLDNDGPITNKMLATQIVAYRGILPFPAIGQVSCMSSVAFADGQEF